jgi:hypothetical protein
VGDVLDDCARSAPLACTCPRHSSACLFACTHCQVAEAKGGVLFVDEAYSIVKASDSSLLIPLIPPGAKFAKFS